MIEELASRREFRCSALWSIEHLTARARTDERLLVERVEDALVARAEALAGWAQQLKLTDGLANGNDTGEVVVGPIDVVRSFIATRPWRDLVSEQDFLSPSSGLNLRQPSLIQAAEFVPMFNHALQQPGDHVAGMTLRRIQFWQQTLDQFFSRCRCTAVQYLKDVADPAAVKHTSDELSDSVRELESVLTHGPAARLREDCVSLVQAYAAYDPPAYRRWAGVSLSNASPPTLSLWLENHDNLRIATRIAAALRRAANTFRQPLSAEDVIADAARSYMLVVIGGAMRRLYWRNEIVPAGWTTVPWETLWALAAAAKRGGAINADSFGRAGDGGSPVTRHGLTSRMSRLAKLTPPEMRKRTDGKKEKGFYRLDVPENEIYLAVVDANGSVIEASYRRGSGYQI